MTRLDTNYIIRFLLNDNKEMAKRAEDVILNETVYISNEVIAEAVYVLEGVYKISKKDISETMMRLLSLKNINVENRSVLFSALHIFQENSLDFVDCLLCGYSKDDEIKTFDKKLQKCIERLLG